MMTPIIRGWRAGCTSNSFARTVTHKWRLPEVDGQGATPPGRPVQLHSLLYSQLLPFSPVPLVSRASLILIRIHATARTPDVVVAVGPIGAAHEAKAEGHVPRVGRTACERRRRPIVGRLDILSAHFGRFTNGRPAPSESASPEADPRMRSTALLSAHAMNQVHGGADAP